MNTRVFAFCTVFAFVSPMQVSTVGVATGLSVGVVSTAFAAKKPRKIAKKKMTKQERRTYRAKKKNLQASRKNANRLAKARSKNLVDAYADAVRYKKAADKAYKALTKQKARLDEAKAKTGFFKPSAKKLASQQRKYEKAVNDFNNGPRKAYNEKAKVFNKAQKDFVAAKKEQANAVNALGDYRLNLGGRLKDTQQRAVARRSTHGQFIKFTKAEAAALNYGQIPPPRNEYAAAPIPAQVYGGFPNP